MYYRELYVHVHTQSEDGRARARGFRREWSLQWIRAVTSLRFVARHACEREPEPFG